MKTFLSNACFAVAFLAVLSCSKKEEVAPETPPSLVGTWTIKSAKNLSASTLTAKANSTITFTDTKYTVSQTQPFANYKNKDNVTEYLRFKSNSTYKLLNIDELPALIDADYKLFFGSSLPAVALKNLKDVMALYKKEGIKYVVTMAAADIVVTPPNGMITAPLPALGVANFTANGFALEMFDYNDQDLSKTTFVAKLPTVRTQILLEK